MPAFAAQLIGQVLPDGHGANLASYASLAAPRMALLLDRVS
jgi:hypothetical protein